MMERPLNPIDVITTKVMYEHGWGRHDGLPIEWDRYDPTSQYAIIRDDVAFILAEYDRLYPRSS